MLVGLLYVLYAPNNFCLLDEKFLFWKTGKSKRAEKTYCRCDAMHNSRHNIKFEKFSKVLFRLETNVLFRWKFSVLCVTSCVELQLAVVDKNFIRCL